MNRFCLSAGMYGYAQKMFQRDSRNPVKQGEVLNIPIAHGDGNYFAEADTIKKLEENGQVVFRYCDESGRVTKESNPNGSVNNIAGIVNEEGNVLGMMPHPERASDVLLGLTDGKRIFESIVHNFASSAQQFAAV